MSLIVLFHGNIVDIEGKPGSIFFHYRIADIVWVWQPGNKSRTKLIQWYLKLKFVNYSQPKICLTTTKCQTQNMSATLLFLSRFLWNPLSVVCFICLLLYQFFKLWGSCRLDGKLVCLGFFMFLPPIFSKISHQGSFFIQSYFLTLIYCYHPSMATWLPLRMTHYRVTTNNNFKDSSWHFWCSLEPTVQF